MSDGLSVGDWGAGIGGGRGVVTGVGVVIVVGLGGGRSYRSYKMAW